MGRDTVCRTADCLATASALGVTNPSKPLLSPTPSHEWATPSTPSTPSNAIATSTLERLEWDSAREENAWWHEHAVAGLQGRTFAETGDADAVFLKVTAARDAVVEELSADGLRDALQRLLPRPPTARYTVVTMTPRRPGPLLAAALAARELWRGAADAAGGEARAAAALAAAGAVVACAAAAAVVVWRRRQAAG